MIEDLGGMDFDPSSVQSNKTDSIDTLRKVILKKSI